MRCFLVSTALTVLVLSNAAPARADAPTPAMIEACIYAAAGLYHEPPAVLLILLNVEGGRLGAVSRNTNGTVDIGPMQVNQLWIPQLASRWHADAQTTFADLRDDFCPNVEAGAWILRQGLDEARGDFWGGVAFYHSHDPGYQEAYLRSVLKQALSLERTATRAPQGSSAAGTSSTVAGGG